MFYTTEYTVLVKDGKEEMKLLPNVPFEEVPAGLLVTAYALIREVESDDIVAALEPGKVTPHIKGVATINYEELSKQDIREILINKGISFPTKATKVKLIALLEG